MAAKSPGGVPGTGATGIGKSLSDFKAKHDPATIIARLEHELKEARSESADARALKEALGTIGLKLNELRSPPWILSDRGSPSAPGVPTLFLSDLHWGEVVHPSQINGVNSFNLSIARERLRYTVETAVSLLKLLDHDMRYPGIVVPLGGDLCSGDIHDELKETNALPTLPTLLDLFDNLVPAIGLLADTFGHVFLPCVTGNHGRNTRKPYAKNRHHTSFDWTLYQFLARHFAADKRVTFFVPDGPDAYYRVFDHRYLLTHGDQFRAGDSIIGPLGPLTRGNQKKSVRNQAVGQEYETLICGHWHRYIPLRRLIVNSTLKGYDEYAYSENYEFEPPMQAMWITHPRNGITFQCAVYCEPQKARPNADWVSAAKVGMPA